MWRWPRFRSLSRSLSFGILREHVFIVCLFLCSICIRHRISKTSIFIIHFQIVKQNSNTDHSHMKMYFATFLKSAPIFFAFLACAEPSSLPATTSNTIDNSWKSKTTTVTDVYAFPALTHSRTYTTNNHVMTTAETSAAFTATTLFTLIGVPPKSKST